ncbi:MAG: DUF5658 family protein [Terriglobales bacterium]
MKVLLSIVVLSVAMQAQSLRVTNFALPDAQKPQPSFWSFENKLNTGILAGLVATDAITTQRGLNEGFHEVNPVMRPFVTHGAAGEAAGSALGFGTAIGVVYLLHHSHHYKAERITMRLIVAGESGFVANNIAVIR